MHTTESKWQDIPLQAAKRLREAADGMPIGLGEMRQAGAIIESLVQALEQKIRELDSLEPSE